MKLPPDARQNALRQDGIRHNATMQSSGRADEQSPKHRPPLCERRKRRTPEDRIRGNDKWSPHLSERCGEDGQGFKRSCSGWNESFGRIPSGNFGAM
jgi:hypothetical protein